VIHARESSPFAELSGFLVQQLEGGIGAADSARTPRLVVYACTAFAVLFLAWAALAPVDRVVRATGRVVPSSKAKTLQHLEGGVVSQIFVREGQRVAAGEPLVAVSDVLFDADRAEQRAKLSGLRARIARLRAEAQGDHQLGGAAASGESSANERLAFEARRARLEQTLSVLRAQASQKNAEMAELETRRAGLSTELDVAKRQLAVISDLHRKSAASQLELLDAQSRLERLTTQFREAEAGKPRMQAALRELAEKEKDATAQFRSEARTALAEAEVEAARLAPEMRKGEDRVQRTVMTAPTDGVVNRLFITTIGGVVKPGETVLELTPADGPVTIEATVNPADRAELREGLPTVVRLAAFDFTVFGTLKGTLNEISADTVSDERGERHFRARLDLEPASLKTFGHAVTPGLTASADIVVGRRTVLEYLLSPIRRVGAHALTEWK
jgi:adhesin transport system membrane fusion protein